jgi:sec-independent protein translocase protein TatA
MPHETPPDAERAAGDVPEYAVSLTRRGIRDRERAHGMACPIRSVAMPAGRAISMPSIVFARGKSLGTFSLTHWLVVLAIILILFGAGKLPRVMGDFAKGIKNFKAGMKDDDELAPSPAKIEDVNEAADRKA